MFYSTIMLYQCSYNLKMEASDTSRKA